jgi:hypothetical protein
LLGAQKHTKNINYHKPKDFSTTDMPLPYIMRKPLADNLRVIKQFFSAIQSLFLNKLGKNLLLVLLLA